MTRAVLKTVVALLAAAAALVLALNTARMVVAPRPLLIAAIVVSASLAALTTIAGSWQEWRDRRQVTRRELTDSHLTATLWAIVDQVGNGLDYRDLGIAAYQVRRAWWAPWLRRLRRVHRVRSSRRPVTSNVTWRPGKGVIGACIARGEVVAVDLTQLYADLGEPDAAEWETLPEGVRLGLDFDEYVDVRQKYAVVVASPMIDDSGSSSRVAGCVALDGPDGRYADLTGEAVLALLDAAAEGVLRQMRTGVA